VRIDRQPVQKGDMRDTNADTTLARADLGFQPSVTLEEGLRAMYRWMDATHE
jgi:nucleoside-diphosphate-sugar epimerase